MYEMYRFENQNKKIHSSKLELNPNSIPFAENILDAINIKNISDRTHLLCYKNFNLGINSGKFVNINKIKIIKGTGKLNGNAFSSVGNIYYKILDIKPYDDDKKESRSIKAEPKKFRIGFTTYGNMTPKEVIKKLTNTLINRLNKIHDELENINKCPYMSDFVEYKKENKLYLIILNGEFWTLSNVIAMYIYKLEKNILYVTSAIKHPDIEAGVIKMNYKEPIKITKIAIKKIKKDLKMMEENFK